MELIERSSPAVKSYVGDDTATVSAGQSLVIETSPEGEEILDAEVPAGKSWAVTISVRVVETDA